jgi:hypothetical protein
VWLVVLAAVCHARSCTLPRSRVCARRPRGCASQTSCVCALHWERAAWLATRVAWQAKKQSNMRRGATLRSVKRAPLCNACHTNCFARGDEHTQTPSRGEGAKRTCVGDGGRYTSHGHASVGMAESPHSTAVVGVGPLSRAAVCVRACVVRSHAQVTCSCSPPPPPLVSPHTGGQRVPRQGRPRRPR